MQRVRGLLSLILLLALLIGVPVVVRMSGALDPPRRWPTPADVVRTVLDGRVSHDAAIGVVALVVMIVWLRFVVSVAIAVVCVIGRRDAPTLWGVGRLTQVWAMALVSGVALVLASGASVNAADRAAAVGVQAGDGARDGARDGVGDGAGDAGSTEGRQRNGGKNRAENPVEGTGTERQRADEACPPVRPGGNPDLPVGLGTAILVAGGVVMSLDRRRRRRLRSGTQADPVSSAAETRGMEVRLRDIAPVERLVRLDLALRLAVPRRPRSGRMSDDRVIDGAILDRNGTVHLLLTERSPAVSPFVDDDDGRWRLPGEMDLAALADVAATTPTRSTGSVLPLAHLGVAESGDVFVDLRAAGVLSIEGEEATSIVRAMASGIALSPFSRGLSVVSVGVQVPIPIAPEMCSVTELDDVDAAVDLIAVHSGPTVLFVGAEATGRVTDVGLPSSCVSSGLVCVVAVGPIPNATWRLRRQAGWWLLEPWSLIVRPVRLEPDDVGDVQRLLLEADGSSVIVSEPTAAVIAPSSAEGAVTGPVPLVSVAVPPSPSPSFREPVWTFVVRVLGPVTVEDRGGREVVMERSKSIELLAWLALHRERQSRSGARTAMWDLDVQDATFANVVSDARRSLARSVPSDHEWLGRTLGDTLPLDPGIVTDADLLEARLAHARSQVLPDAVETLRGGLAWVRGMPCADTGYRWPDADGTTSRLVMLVTAAAVDMATRCLVVDDLEGLFWATGRGLMALPGHEELVGLRMRGHARRGDRAGVRHEWGTYVRSLRIDSWCEDDPSPKLVALREELLAGDRAAIDGIDIDRADDTVGVV